MKKRVVHLFAVLYLSSISSFLFGQRYDNTWLLGKDTIAIEVNIIDFGSIPPSIAIDTAIIIKIAQTDISISDENGNLLFYSNGLEIYNAQHQIMANSEGFNDSPYQNFNFVDGMPINQGLIALPPLTAESNLYHLFHMKIEKGYITTPDDRIRIADYGLRLFYTSINSEANNGLGAVETKAMFLLQDTLAPGKMTAIRHANGRDWWIVIPRQNSNLFYRILLTPDGPQMLAPQSIGEHNIYATLGQAVSSPDGNWIAFDKIVSKENEWYFLQLFSFDRCDGLLSNPVRFKYAPPINFGGGLAFSPDSRYLYQANSSDLLQYDLQAADITASQKVGACYDAHTNEYGSFFFYNTQLAYNGKIYINPSNANNALHEITKPNFSGAMCDLRQRQISLPYPTFSALPTYPNYRLGPLDGSPCDTLNLNNTPLSNFYYETDEINAHFVSFFDNSFYEVQNWFWDFGDGNTSTRPNPLHEYQESGLYSVCLTVSNGYGENTLCQSVQIPQ